MPRDSLLAELPGFTTMGAEAVSRVARHMPAGFDLGEQPLVAELGRKGWPGIAAGWTRAVASLEGHSILAAIDPDLLPHATARWSELSAVGMPHALRPVMLGVVLGEVTALVERWCGVRPAWAEDGGAAQSRPHAVLLRRPEGGGPLGALALDDAALAWLGTRLDAAGPPRRLDLDALPVALALVAARLVLSVTELGALGVGDVVLLDAGVVLPGGGLDVVVRPEGQAGLLRGRLSGGRLEIDAQLDGRLDMPDDAAPQGLPPPSLEDLPMTVECEAGRLTLPLSRLRELAPGQVLDLGFDATARVTLRVNGQVIGIGELVRIAERTGVRLTELRLARGA